jgi:hypothetical protein
MPQSPSDASRNTTFAIGEEALPAFPVSNFDSKLDESMVSNTNTITIDLANSSETEPPSPDIALEVLSKSDSVPVRSEITIPTSHPRIVRKIKFPAKVIPPSSPTKLDVSEVRASEDPVSPPSANPLGEESIEKMQEVDEKQPPIEGDKEKEPVKLILRFKTRRQSDSPVGDKRDVSSSPVALSRDAIEVGSKDATSPLQGSRSSESQSLSVSPSLPQTSSNGTPKIPRLILRLNPPLPGSEEVHAHSPSPPKEVLPSSPRMDRSLMLASQHAGFDKGSSESSLPSKKNLSGSSTPSRKAKKRKKNEEGKPRLSPAGGRQIQKKESIKRKSKESSPLEYLNTPQVALETKPDVVIPEIVLESGSELEASPTCPPMDPTPNVGSQLEHDHPAAQEEVETLLEKSPTSVQADPKSGSSGLKSQRSVAIKLPLAPSLKSNRSLLSSSFPSPVTELTSVVAQNVALNPSHLNEVGSFPSTSVPSSKVIPSAHTAYLPSTGAALFDSTESDPASFPPLRATSKSKEKAMQGALNLKRKGSPLRIASFSGKRNRKMEIKYLLNPVQTPLPTSARISGQTANAGEPPFRSLKRTLISMPHSIKREEEIPTQRTAVQRGKLKSVAPAGPPLPPYFPFDTTHNPPRDHENPPGVSALISTDFRPVTNQQRKYSPALLPAPTSSAFTLRASPHSGNQEGMVQDLTPHPSLPKVSTPGHPKGPISRQRREGSRLKRTTETSMSNEELSVAMLLAGLNNPSTAGTPPGSPPPFPNRQS